MRVGGYPRVSTEEQAEDGYSIQEQIESIQQWCKDRGYPPAVIEPYIDDGYSAKDLNRPGIKRLIEDIDAKKYDIIITTKLNRLSRKLYDILNMIDLIERCNGVYISVQESFDTSTYIGRMQMQMLGVIAEFDRERIAEDVRNTMKSIARKSGDTKKAFTTPCYGLDVIDGVHVINRTEQVTVNQIADWILNGKGTRFVSKTLNEMGVKSKTGKTWDPAVITQLLQNESLYGTLVYNRTYMKNGKKHFRPESEWIIIEDHHPAVIDQSKRDELMKAIAGRKQSRKQADNEKWLLSGLVKCAHCGSTMKGATSKTHNRKDRTIFKEYTRYVCSSYHSKGLCFYHYMFRDDLEKFVIDYIIDVAHSNNVKKIKLNVSEPKNKDAERQSVLAKLSRIDARMQKQIEAYEIDLISPSDLKKARERIDEERTILNKQLASMDAEHADQDNTQAHSNAKRYLNDVLSDNRLTSKTAIRQIISQIIVSNGESVEIYFHSK